MTNLCVQLAYAHLQNSCAVIHVITHALVHRTSSTLPFLFFYQSVCIKPEKFAIYVCVRGIDFASFHKFDTGFWNCWNSVVFSVFHFFVIYSLTMHATFIILDQIKNSQQQLPNEVRRIMPQLHISDQIVNTKMSAHDGYWNNQILLLAAIK